MEVVNPFDKARNVVDKAELVEDMEEKEAIFEVVEDEGSCLQKWEEPVDYF